MKKHITLIILALAGLTSCASVAQLSGEYSTHRYPDGIYYKPNPESLALQKEKKEEIKNLIVKTHDTLIVPDNMAVKLSYDKNDGLTDVTLFDSRDLLWNTSFSFRFGPFYNSWYYNSWYNRWNWHFGWYDPWYFDTWAWRYSWYDPWFSPWYDPWYGPWYYDRWGWGYSWYDPWYSPWYDPWYGPGFGPGRPGHHPVGPGYNPSIGRRGVFNPAGANRVVTHATPAARNTGAAAARPSVKRTVTGTGATGARTTISNSKTPVKRVAPVSGTSSRTVSGTNQGIKVTPGNTNSSGSVRKPQGTSRTIMSSGNNASGNKRSTGNNNVSNGNRSVNRTYNSNNSGSATRSTGGNVGGGNMGGGGFSGGGSGAGGSRNTGGGGLPGRR